jgi:hypothetical protein
MLATNQVASVEEFHNADGLPFRTIPWLFIVPGIVLLAVCAGAFTLSRAPLHAMRLPQVQSAKSRTTGSASASP